MPIEYDYGIIEAELSRDRKKIVRVSVCKVTKGILGPASIEGKDTIVEGIRNGRSYATFRKTQAGWVKEAGIAIYTKGKNCFLRNDLFHRPSDELGGLPGIGQA